MRKGYSPAKYFLLAFSIFIGAVVVFVMKDAGVILTMLGLSSPCRWVVRLKWYC